MEVRSVADDDYGGQIRDLCGQGTPIGGGGGGGKREKKKGRKNIPFRWFLYRTLFSYFKEFDYR